MTSYTPAQLLKDFSLEMTGKDVPGLLEAALLIPKDTRVNVTFLGNEGLQMRIFASKAVLDGGGPPGAAHFGTASLLAGAARGVPERAARPEQLGVRVLFVGGDPSTPEGPYEDSHDVIKTGLLQQYGAKDLSIAGYPEGQPDISEE